jgi:5-methylcytosine-specific restriction endonuclease McrA
MTRATLALLVPCPRCGAAADDPCLKVNGKPSKRVCPQRKDRWCWHRFFARRGRYRRRWRSTAEGQHLLSEAVDMPCPLCGQVMWAETLMELDHVVPFGIGGRDELSNLRAVCAECNQRRPRNGSDISLSSADIEPCWPGHREEPR